MQRALVGQSLVDLTKLTRFEIMRINRHQNFTCERCSKPLVFKHGTRKKAHFSHVQSGIKIINPESAVHRLAKETMAKWLHEQGIKASVERRFPSIDRIADVYFEYEEMGYVFEVQRSVMSETEFNKRNADYRQLGIEVIWVFLGELKQYEGSYRLPPVMQGRAATRLIHFCTKTTHVTLFEDPVYVSSKELYGKVTCAKLKNYGMQDVLGRNSGQSGVTKQWLEVKRHFRRRGWYFASKSEKKLVEQCLLRGFNLAQVPVEVGWPVSGNGIRKHLFVWQSYIFLGIIKFFKVGDVFSVQDVTGILKMEYGIKERKGTRMQVKKYLLWLVRLKMLGYNNAYFEYRLAPDLTLSMDACLKIDDILVKKFSV
ncbi:MAG: hypothetical protein FWE07_03995 [Turicibacter sp.]|nr:hypothetical protein [Turicibacter sp.]